MRPLVIGVLVVAAMLVAALAWRERRLAPLTHAPYADPARAALLGRVVDPAGRPLAGVEVQWFQAVGEPGLFGGSMFQGDERRAVTAADGSFRLDGLPPSKGYVAASAAAPTYLEGAGPRAALPAGNECSGYVLEVAEVPLARRTAGRVLRADGSAAAGMTLVVSREAWRGNWREVVVTGPDGGFEVVSPWAGGECAIAPLAPGVDPPPLGRAAVGTRGVVLRQP